MAKPIKYPVKKVLSFADEMLDAIDAWRSTQRPLPNQNEAIRQMLTEYLKEKGYLK